MILIIAADRGGDAMTTAAESSELREIKSYLEELGFSDVRIEIADSYPEHIATWIKENDILGKNINRLEKEQPYLRIMTSQGSFGILTGPYPVVDIHGTNVTAQDLGLESEYPPFMLDLTDDKDVLHFRNLLEARR